MNLTRLVSDTSLIYLKSEFLTTRLFDQKNLRFFLIYDLIKLTKPLDDITPVRVEIDLISLINISDESLVHVKNMVQMKDLTKVKI